MNLSTSKKTRNGEARVGETVAPLTTKFLVILIVSGSTLLLLGRHQNIKKHKHLTQIRV